MSNDGKHEAHPAPQLAAALRRTVAASALGALVVAGPGLALASDYAEPRPPIETKTVGGPGPTMEWLLEQLMRERKGETPPDEVLRSMILAGIDCGHTSHSQYVCKPTKS
jgi:hypothetical protein